MPWNVNEFRENIDNVIRIMQSGQKITAIKELRAASSLGLKEAKDIVEAFYDYVQPKDLYAQVPYEDPDQGEFAVVRSTSDGHVYYETYASKHNAMHEARALLERGYDDVKVARVVAKTKRTVEEI